MPNTFTSCFLSFSKNLFTRCTIYISPPPPPLYYHWQTPFSSSPENCVLARKTSQTHLTRRSYKLYVPQVGDLRPRSGVSTFVCCCGVLTLFPMPPTVINDPQSVPHGETPKAATPVVKSLLWRLESSPVLPPRRAPPQPALLGQGVLSDTPNNVFSEPFVGVRSP